MFTIGASPPEHRRRCRQDREGAEQYRALLQALLEEREDPAHQEEGDEGHRRGRPVITHSTPFVLGTPVARGSSSDASRRALARALNWASTMWWALRP